MSINTAQAVASAASTASQALQSEPNVKPLLDMAFWTSAPSIIWAIGFFSAVVYFRREIAALFSALVFRIKDGAPIKVAGIEIGSASGLVARPGGFSAEDTRVGVYQDDKSRELQRQNIYEESRGVMLVHQIQRANKDGQLYDILLYVIPHKSSLAGVVTVEYFFGSFWGNKVYPSHDRSRGFPVVTSAYGAFLCTAKVNFNDGTSTIIQRYIDFEMGHAATRPSASA
jgi:hypothetical protein